MTFAIRTGTLLAIVPLVCAGNALAAPTGRVFGCTQPPYETGYVALFLDGTPVYASASGWYQPTGFHYALNSNYLAEFENDGTAYNDFFGFTIPQGHYSSAVLSAFNPSGPGCGFYSTQRSITFSIYDVTTSFSALTSNHGYGYGPPLAPDIFIDLASGRKYGSSQRD